MAQIYKVVLEKIVGKDLRIENVNATSMEDIVKFYSTDLDFKNFHLIQIEKVLDITRNIRFNQTINPCPVTGGLDRLDIDQYFNCAVDEFCEEVTNEFLGLISRVGFQSGTDETLVHLVKSWVTSSNGQELANLHSKIVQRLEELKN